MDPPTPGQGPLPVPDSFPFPFPPYDIQDSFMRALFQTLESGQFGIFESPTGTGKSLSLICGALAWFSQRERRRIEELEAAIVEVIEVEEDDDNWLQSAVRNQEGKERRREAMVELKTLREKEERMQELRRRRKSIVLRNETGENKEDEDDIDGLLRDSRKLQMAAKRELMDGDGRMFDEQDEEIIVEDYLSDDDAGDGESKSSGWGEEDEKIEDYSLRIFYCSRTHSQLSQFVKEIQKSPFADNIRLVSLASRNNMCVNESVKKLGNSSLINEKCLDMQKKGGKAKPVDSAGKTKKGKAGSGACPFRKQSTVGVLRDQALLQVMDLEQLVSNGRQVKGCPYYASRGAVGDAQIIVLPYNTLLHKPTRDVIGINLKNSVVIIDEAHNLLETLSHIHSVELSGQQLCRTHSQVQQYLDRYKTRLKAKNHLYIKQILFLIASFIRVLGGKVGGGADVKVQGESRLIKPEALMDQAELFNLNIHKLIRYIKRSKIAQKLHGFAEKYANDGKVTVKVPEDVKKGVTAYLQSLSSKPKVSPAGDAADAAKRPKEHQAAPASPPQSHGSPLLIVLEFMQALVNVVAEARILISFQTTLGQSSIKYCLLNPSSQFQDLVRECRSIIVAGGTMQPISEFKERLFISSGSSPERISHFSCGHVIPKENILPLVIPSGPTGRTLDFSFGKRDEQDTLTELFRVLLNLINVIPHGVVVFFPSYDYERKVYDHWEASGALEKIQAKKRVFREPKRSSDMDKVLSDYSKSAKSVGALLFSVVGGKMSEGINFSDELGRCVIMVGLPFPNARSLELKEKMAYLDRTCGKVEDGRTAGQAHYESLCMKAVNQSIGRAIRHKGDFAAILLLDHRYKRAGIRGQLPQWIEKHVVELEKFPQGLSMISKFFKGKEKAQ